MYVCPFSKGRVHMPPRKSVLAGGEGSAATSWLEGLSLMEHFVHLQAEINLPACWRTADQVTSHPPALWLPTPCAYCESSVGGENYWNRLESANSSVWADKLYWPWRRGWYCGARVLKACCWMGLFVSGAMWICHFRPLQRNMGNGWLKGGICHLYCPSSQIIQFLHRAPNYNLSSSL